jgi:hypothetical protein
MSKLNVFISSTCFDRSTSYSISDIREKLRVYLEACGCGFLVKLSEVVFSSFYVDPTMDSIENCLQNVKSSDVVVAIITDKYGPPLGKNFENKSATHLEIECARDNKIPVLFFVDKETNDDFSKYKKGKRGTPYFEKDDKKRRRQMATFLRDVKSLSDAQQDEYSNWTDIFVPNDDDELIKMVYKRLNELRQRYSKTLSIIRTSFITRFS